MRRQRGSVFVYSLAVMAALIGVLAAVASTERLDVKAADNRKELIQARMACMSAFQRYLATVANDLAGGGATTTGSTSGTTSTIAQTTGATTLQDDWAQLGSNGDENVVVGGTHFRMQVLDASSYINMSSPTFIASTAWQTNLPLSQQQIDAFHDFTTGGENATADGAKDPYYNGLNNPYNAKLAPLDTLDELLQVRYFNPAAIWLPNTNIVSTVTYTAGPNGQQPTLYDLVTPYSYSPNVQPGPLGQQQPRINISGRVAAATIQRLAALGLTGTTRTLLQNGTAATMGALMARVPSIQDKRILLDDCSFTAGTRIQGLINLNTASVNVLSSIPGINPDIAQALVTQQQTGYTRMSDCLNVAGYSGATLNNTISYFCVESSTFLVRVIGYSGSASVAMEATIDIINNKPRIVRMADVPFTDVIGRWNWNSTTSTDTILKEAS